MEFKWHHEWREPSDKNAWKYTETSEPAEESVGAPRAERRDLHKTWLWAVLGILSLALVWWTLTPNINETEQVTKALVVLQAKSGVSGTINFKQADKNGPVTISGEIYNLDPSAKRGFHVHQLGDISDNCLSAGSHFNPFKKNHGSPTDSERHVGDLGNIESDELGVARFNFQDSKISLNGPRSILGRAIVLHAGIDDLGRGKNEESLKTGNAGARAACGVIGRA